LAAVALAGDGVAVASGITTLVAFVFSNGWSLGFPSTLIRFALAQASRKEDCQKHSGTISALISASTSFPKLAAM
jgi:hypothetical protein